jgi:hypothetical protein
MALFETSTSSSDAAMQSSTLDQAGVAGLGSQQALT